MSPRSWLPGLLAGIGSVLAPPPGRGQEVVPLPAVALDPVGATGPAWAGSAPPASAWYAAAEVAVLFTVANHYNEHVAAPWGDTPEFLSSRVYLGYGLEGGGAVRFTYRNLTQVSPDGSTGRDPRFSSGQSFTIHSFDLDYVTSDWAPADWWRVDWEAGARFVYRRQDWWNKDPWGRDEIAVTFAGVGPHVGMTSRWLLGESGWAAFARADAAVAFGSVRGTREYRPLQPDPWGLGARPSERSTSAAFQFDLGLQLGLGRRWQWQGWDVGFAAGVQADALSLGNLRGAFGMTGLFNVGPFVRWEIGF